MIIFEGSPGAGKSSLSQYLAHRLRDGGRDPVWVEEHELNEEWFDRFFEALDSEAGDAVAAGLECWRDLLAQVDADERTYLVDGAYFHTGVKSLLAHNCSAAQIDSYLDDLHRLLAPYQPVIVHLVGDVRAIMQHAIAERGPQWAAGIAEQIADYPCQAGKERSVAAMIDFFVTSQAELHRLAARYPFECWTIDTTARDWPGYQQSLAQRLDLSQPEAPVPAALEMSLEEYVGVYPTPDGFPDEFRHPLEVEMGKDGLRLHTIFLRNFRLVAQQRDSFAIAARPLELEFVRDETGRLTGLIYPFVPGQRFFCPKAS